MEKQTVNGRVFKCYQIDITQCPFQDGYELVCCRDTDNSVLVSTGGRVSKANHSDWIVVAGEYHCIINNDMYKLMFPVLMV